jgi:hypothetical protein
MTARTSNLLFLSFFLTNLLFLLIFADRKGYEGDDLNSILPMLHLQEAKHGNLLIYRYAWQPLSYEIGSWVFRLAGNPSAIFLLAPLTGAISLSLLLSIVWRDKSSASNFLKSVVALIAVPELWFSGLYFNSTVLGLPFAAGSLALLRSNPTLPISSLAGLLLGLASITRLDFILAGPALAVIAWNRGRSFAPIISFAFGVFAIFVSVVLAGLVDIHDVIGIYRESTQEIAAKAHQGGWDLRAKLGVLSVMLSPVGWLVLLLGGPITVFYYVCRSTLTSFLWFFALIPLCLPLPNLLSVKYAIPLLMFIPSFLVLCISSIEQWIPQSLAKLPLGLLSVASLIQAFVSVSFTGSRPFVHMSTLAYRPVGTHDGLRSYGGYLWQIQGVDRLAQPTEHQLLASQLAEEFFRKDGPDIVIVGEEDFFDRGGAGWRDLQLLLELSNIRGVVVAPHEIQFVFKGRKLTLLRDLPSDFSTRYDRGVGVKLYDWRENES